MQMDFIEHFLLKYKFLNILYQKPSTLLRNLSIMGIRLFASLLVNYIYIYILPFLSIITHFKLLYFPSTYSSRILSARNTRATSASEQQNSATPSFCPGRVPP